MNRWFAFTRAVVDVTKPVWVTLAVASGALVALWLAQEVLAAHERGLDRMARADLHWRGDRP